MSDRNNNVGQPAQNSAAAERALLPPVDVIEDATGIRLYADLPGVSRDKLSIQLDADRLSIEGEVTLASPEGMTANHVEVDQPHYRRVFILSQELDGSKVSATLNHGVLCLHIPKAEHAQPRKIDVQVA